jgi:nuclear cap-binding protein subunit 1
LLTCNVLQAFGLELVKIILLTLPFAVAASKGDANDIATELLASTEVIASAQHPLEGLVEPYFGDDEDKPVGFQSIIGLLQKQLASESDNGWALKIIPRPYQPIETPVPEATNGEQNGETKDDANGETEDKAEGENGDATLQIKEFVPPTKHALPTITVPSTPNPGSKPHFPETYFSLYADQSIRSVPPTDDLASCLIRDTMIDTINIFDFNRNATAKALIELDCFWAQGTFARRATPFDKLTELTEGSSTWKPEDMAVDAIFSQIVTLPAPEHKLVYYHAVITETCKIAPAAIAPSLGRAIRFLYKHIASMDMELGYRFMDWFGHHLSNFEFRWKWAEWIEDVGKGALEPCKAFIIGALDKEIRLSFATRIRKTLPEEYHDLIGEGKEKDTPDFKYNDPGPSPWTPSLQFIFSLIFVTTQQRHTAAKAKSCSSSSASASPKTTSKSSSTASAPRPRSTVSTRSSPPPTPT